MFLGCPSTSTERGNRARRFCDGPCRPSSRLGPSSSKAHAYLTPLRCARGHGLARGRSDRGDGGDSEDDLAGTLALLVLCSILVRGARLIGLLPEKASTRIVEVPERLEVSPDRIRELVTLVPVAYLQKSLLYNRIIDWRPQLDDSDVPTRSNGWRRSHNLFTCGRRCHASHREPWGRTLKRYRSPRGAHRVVAHRCSFGLRRLSYASGSGMPVEGWWYAEPLLPLSVLGAVIDGDMAVLVLHAQWPGRFGHGATVGAERGWVLGRRRETVHPRYRAAAWSSTQSEPWDTRMAGGRGHSQSCSSWARVEQRALAVWQRSRQKARAASEPSRERASVPRTLARVCWGGRRGFTAIVATC